MIVLLVSLEILFRVSGPTAELYGYTPKQALAYLRSRPTNDGIPGVGATADPYLDECAAAGRDVFETLVRNERRIELCFEGQRFHDLRRWATDVSELNDVINRPRITRQSIAYEEVEKRSYPSLYVPIPYTEVVRMKGIVQNAGWSNWE